MKPGLAGGLRVIFFQSSNKETQRCIVCVHRVNWPDPLIMLVNENVGFCLTSSLIRLHSTVSSFIQVVFFSRYTNASVPCALFVGYQKPV